MFLTKNFVRLNRSSVLSRFLSHTAKYSPDYYSQKLAEDSFYDDKSIIDPPLVTKLLNGEDISDCEPNNPIPYNCYLEMAYFYKKGYPIKVRVHNIINTFNHIEIESVEEIQEKIAKRDEKRRMKNEKYKKKKLQKDDVFEQVEYSKVTPIAVPLPPDEPETEKRIENYIINCSLLHYPSVKGQIFIPDLASFSKMHPDDIEKDDILTVFIDYMDMTEEEAVERIYKNELLSSHIDYLSPQYFKNQFSMTPSSDVFKRIIYYELFNKELKRKFIPAGFLSTKEKISNCFYEYFKSAKFLRSQYQKALEQLAEEKIAYVMDKKIMLNDIKESQLLLNDHEKILEIQGIDESVTITELLEFLKTYIDFQEKVQDFYYDTRKHTMLLLFNSVGDCHDASNLIHSLVLRRNKLGAVPLKFTQFQSNLFRYKSHSLMIKNITNEDDYDDILELVTKFVSADNIGSIYFPLHKQLHKQMKECQKLGIDYVPDSRNKPCAVVELRDSNMVNYVSFFLTIY